MTLTMPKRKREDGSGTLRQATTGIWSLRYVNEHGRKVTKCLHTSSKKEAQNLAREITGRVAAAKLDQQPVRRRRKTRDPEYSYDDAMNLWTKHRGTRALHTRRIHLDPVFGGRAWADIIKNDLTVYIETRRAQGASDPTIQREISTLRMVMNFALDQGLLDPVLVQDLNFKRLSLAPTRERDVYWTDDQVVATATELLNHPKAHAQTARDLFLLSWLTGWRRNEVHSLNYESLTTDADGARVIFLPKIHGNKKGSFDRVWPYDQVPLMKEILQRRREFTERCGLTPAGEQPLFHYETRYVVDSRGNKHVHPGRRIKDVRALVKECAEHAGIRYGESGVIWHDLRRSAIRNLERSGVPRSIAIELVGHRTEAIFNRYARASASKISNVTEALEAVGRTTAPAVDHLRLVA